MPQDSTKPSFWNSYFPAAMLFKHLIRKGRLDVIDASGRTHVFAGQPGEHIIIKLHDPSLHWSLITNPQINLPEAYMFGTLTIEQGDLDGFLLLMARNNQEMRNFFISYAQTRLRYHLRWLWQNNSVQRAMGHIQFHYDISNELYKLFLDKDMQYSCAYFKDPNETLEQAQINKKNHIIAKLDLQPGQKVLDIGCGWGGLAMEMAKQKGVHVTGVTLSQQQHELGMERVRAAGLQDGIELKLLDYRHLQGTFDRIVSVGMFEHVGLPHFPEYFSKVHELMAEDGRMLLHSIGYKKPSLATQPWLEKYMFRKGYLPSLGETLPHIEKAGFWVTDAEVLRLHYSYTLREWKKRFRANRDQIVQMNGEVFYRMFDLYLAGCEMAMIHSGTMAFQVQFAKNINAVPITRDYIYGGEEESSSLRMVG